MDFGGKWGQRDGQTDIGEGVGLTIWGLSGPGPGGDTGGLSVRGHPFPPQLILGLTLPKMVFFQPKIGLDKGGVHPHLPLTIEGSPMSFFLGGGLDLGG